MEGMLRSSTTATTAVTTKFLSLLVILLASSTTLASANANANANAIFDLSSPSTSSSPSSAGQTPDASLANARYPEYPPRDPPNTVYIRLEVGATDKPSPRSIVTLIEKIFLTDFEGEGETENEDPKHDHVQSSIEFSDEDVGGGGGDGEDDDEDERNSRARFVSSLESAFNPIIRTGKLPFPSVRAIFSVDFLITVPEGTTCTLDEVEKRKTSRQGRFWVGDKLLDQSHVVPNTIPFSYKPYVKLASGITCVQRQFS